MADRLPIEHYIEECFVKCAQVVLGARIFQPDQSRPAPDKRSARWFLLEVEELAGLTARMEPWRRDVFTPLVIEVYIQPWDTSAVMPGAALAGRQGSNESGSARGTLLERWSLSYSPLQPGSSGYCSRAATDVAAVYKRLILLIRSLYSYVRVLPAYCMYRASKRHGSDLFRTRYTLSTTPQQQQQQQQAAAAGSGAGRKCQFTFSPVETATGQFGITVEYQPATTVHFLEQTAVLPRTPRIISDYVDSNAEGPYARSAPNSGGRMLAAAAAAAAAGAAAGDRAAGQQGEDAGAPSFLRSPQQRAPLVRHSWSSRDTSAARVVQPGFNPIARSNSLNASGSINTNMTASGSGSTVGQQAGQQSVQQQQQQVLLHRSLSQGSGTQSPRGALNLHNAAAACKSGVTGGSSPVIFHGPSSLGRPPLPHSGGLGYSSMVPASGGLGCNNSNNINSSGNAALPPASPVTPMGAGSSSRVGFGVGSSGGGSPLLLRSASAGAAAAVSSAAAAAAAAAGAAAGAAAAALSSTSLGSAAVGHLSRLGSSLGSSPRSGPRVLGFSLQTQQQQQQQQQQRWQVPPMLPQARQQGFHVRDATATNSSNPSSTQQQQQQQQQLLLQDQVQVLSSSSGSESDAGLLAAAAAAADRERSTSLAAAAAAAGYSAASQGSSNSLHSSAKHEAQDTRGDFRVSGSAVQPPTGLEPAAAAAAAAASPSGRAVSAPVMIPGRGKCKARSVTDLPQMAAEMQQQAALQQQQSAAGGAAAAAAAAALNPRLAWLPQGQQMQGTARDAAAAAGDGGSAACGVWGSGLRGGRVQGGLSAAWLSGTQGSLLRVQCLQQQQGQQQQQLSQKQQQQQVLAPSSAPAAPRGMLGQLLSGQTSPSFSPPGPAAAAANNSSNRSRQHSSAAAGDELFDVETEDPAATAATAGDNSLQDTSAAGAGTSSSASSNPLQSRTSNQGSANAYTTRYPTTSYPVSMAAAQPSTPGSCAAAAAAAGAMTVGSSGAGGPAILSSSPQLPFAFTPSAASLGMSLISLADQHRNFLGGTSVGSGPGTSLGSGSGTTPGSGRGSAIPRYASGSAAGGPAPRSTLAPAAAAGHAPTSAAGTSSAAAAAAAGQAIPGSSIGTASSSHGGIGTPSPPPHQHHVSCVRDISGLATIRRPSWSSRSSSFDVAASASLPHHLSMSPMMGDLLDPVLLGCSSSNGSHGGCVGQHLGGAAAAAAAAAGRGVMSGGRGRGAGVLMTPAVVLPGGFGPSQQEDGEVAAAAAAAAAAVGQCGAESLGQGAEAAAAINDNDTTGAAAGDGSAAAGVDAAPTGDAAAADDDDGVLDQQQQQLASALPDESESDILPFAIDSEACASHAVCCGPHAGAAPAAGYSRVVLGAGHIQQQQQPGQQSQRSTAYGTSAAPGVPAGAAAAAAERDVAVGAFVKLVQHAAAVPFQRTKQHRWAGQGCAAAAEQQQQQQEPLLIGDALQQVQQLAAQLQALVFSSSAG